VRLLTARFRVRIPVLDALLEPVTVGPEEFDAAAAEFARSVQIVSRLPDHYERARVSCQGSGFRLAVALWSRR
jgi:hypothetical protein